MCALLTRGACCRGVVAQKGGAVDLANRRCQGAGCERRAIYGRPREGACAPAQVAPGTSAGPGVMGSGKGRERGLRDQEASTELRTGPRFCSKHKRETDVDLVNTRCREPGCGKHPSYGEASWSPDGAGRKTLYPPSPRKSLLCKFLPRMLPDHPLCSRGLAHASSFCMRA